MNLALALVLAASAAEPARITVTKDNTVIDSDAVIVIPPGTVIPDPDNNGVIQITKPGVKVSFADGSMLMGADVKAPHFDGWDALTGQGIRITAKNVSLTNAHVHGYKVGIHATDADGLMLDTIDASDNYRARLKSTREAEDGGDWLSGHHNDNNQWITNYGGAISVQRADGATLRNITVRRGQNGILLERVTNSKIYDNDVSFLSGWGLALWRSSNNTISRNAIDFCVRGHVEGVYNRGQDSAGIKFFEQCSNNVLAENSATHGGDGFFGFAGLEALGETPLPPGFDFKNKGSNNNLFIDNDFSYAPAHGLELTFSFGNQIIRNRFIENAICGVWGGYSQDTLIAENIFEGNGGMAYGLERGAVNIEHSANNRILNNKFLNNKVAVHIWWDADPLPKSKWGMANYKGVVGNVIANNQIEMNADHPFKPRRANGPKVDLIGVQLRDDSPEGQPRKVVGTIYADNQVKITGDAGRELDLGKGIEIVKQPASAADTTYTIPKYEVLGVKKPVGARKELAGRANIICDEWGPWDHSSPLIISERVDGMPAFRVFGVKEATIKPAADSGVKNWTSTKEADGSLLVKPTGMPNSALVSYGVEVSAGSFQRTFTGTVFSPTWNLVAFPWSADTDPQKDAAAWRKLAASDQAVKFKLEGELNFPFGGGGLSDIARSVKALSKVDFKGKNLTNDHFGIVATTKANLPAGKYRIVTTSDDGIRVLVGDRAVIDNFTWHAPTRDVGEFTHDKAGPVDIKIEYFEIDGAATLEFALQKLD